MAPVLLVEQVVAQAALIGSVRGRCHDAAVNHGNRSHLLTDVVIIAERTLGDIHTNNAAVSAQIQDAILQQGVVERLVAHRLHLQFRHVVATPVFRQQVDIAVTIDDDQLTHLLARQNVIDAEITEHRRLVVGLHARVLRIVAVEVAVAQHIERTTHLHHLVGVVIGGINMPVAIVSTALR